MDVDPATEDVHMEDATGAAEEEDGQRQDQQQNLPVEPVHMLMYYEHSYPVGLLHRWLSYGKDTLFRRREFVFQKPAFNPDGTPQGKDLMARYKSYETAADLLKGISAFEPHRIEIGPVYTHQPKLREKAVGKFEAVERELIFDIDASDYDDIRVCCKEKKMCDACWEFMVAGVRALDAILEEDFGFRHRLWIFSGRRGVHCWVSDEKARRLTNDQRAAVAKYIEVFVAGRSLEESRLVVEKDLQMGTVHPFIANLLVSQLRPAFAEIVLNLDNPNNLSNAVVAESVRSIFNARMAGSPLLPKVGELLQKCVDGTLSPADTWSAIKHLHPPRGAGQYGRHNPMDWVPTVVELMYTYPRLDVMVSTKRNHLLKSPYSIHPGTGMLCVPFLPSELDEFKPFRDAPHLSRLGQGPLPRINLLETYVERLEEQRAAEESAADANMS